MDSDFTENEHEYIIDRFDIKDIIDILYRFDIIDRKLLGRYIRNIVSNNYR